MILVYIVIADAIRAIDPFAIAIYLSAGFLGRTPRRAVLYAGIGAVLLDFGADFLLGQVPTPIPRPVVVALDAVTWMALAYGISVWRLRRAARKLQGTSRNSPAD